MNHISIYWPGSYDSYRPPDTRKTEKVDYPQGAVEFIEFHRPPLEDGIYTLELSQELKVKGRKRTDFEPDFMARFVVQGERFSIDPKEVKAVFPPPGSDGDHANVLPHVLFDRSTLPWERTARRRKKDETLGDDDPPWLALLLFHDDEADRLEVQTLTLGDLHKGSGDPAFPELELEPGQQSADKATVIDVARELLETIMPTAPDLYWLVHVRQPKDELDQPEGEPLAVVVCNRLPAPAARSTAHLVSVEGRYDENGLIIPKAAKKVRLVSLKSWTFHCLDPEKDFAGLVRNLDRLPGTLRLPIQPDSTLERYFSQGYAPLPHATRAGNRTGSWYRGPLLPGEDKNLKEGGPLPAPAADTLVRFYQDVGMFDVSYAAAWELGRLMALRDKGFSLALFDWKRQQVQAWKHRKMRAARAAGPSTEHLCVGNWTPAPIPESVSHWYRELAVLKGIPFNYLVADERLLPRESIRFFRIDPLWMSCLFDGAFSIGRGSSSDFEFDAELPMKPEEYPFQPATGLLMRSAVVAGWPHVEVEGYQPEDVDKVDHEAFVLEHKCRLLRREILSPNVLLCLFEGDVKIVDVHLKQEMIHFGVNKGVDEDGRFTSYTKKLRDCAGEEFDTLEIKDIDWRGDAKKGVVDIGKFADHVRRRMADFYHQASGDSHAKCYKDCAKNYQDKSLYTSAQFGLEMIEGVEKVRFLAASGISGQGDVRKNVKIWSRVGNGSTLELSVTGGVEAKARLLVDDDRSTELNWDDSALRPGPMQYALTAPYDYVVRLSLVVKTGDDGSVEAAIAGHGQPWSFSPAGRPGELFRATIVIHTKKS